MFLAPNDVRIKVTGYENYPFFKFNKLFGINFETLQYEEKMLFCEFVLDTYNLDTWEESKNYLSSFIKLNIRTRR